MKLRFTPKKIIFRISQEELNNLINGKAVLEKLPLPNEHAFQYKIDMIQEGEAILINYHDHCLQLYAPLFILEFLANKPSKEGIINSYRKNNQEITFSLQLELK